MTLNELMGIKEINSIEKLIFIYLQFNKFKSSSELEPIFKVSGVTLRRSLSNLRKLGLVEGYIPKKLDLGVKDTSTKEKRVIAQKEFTVIIKEK